MQKLLLAFLALNTSIAFSMQLDTSELPAGEYTEYLTGCLNGKTKEVLSLLEKHPYLSSIKDKNGKTGLILAAGNGHVTTLQAILPNHSDADKAMRSEVPKAQETSDSDTEPGTALWWAYYHDWELCVNALKKLE